MQAFRGFTEYLGLNRLNIYLLRDTSRDQLHTITPTCLIGKATQDERAVKRGMASRLENGVRRLKYVRVSMRGGGTKGMGYVIEGCRAFESRRLCWMCGGASINSYWFRCRLQRLPLQLLLFRSPLPWRRTVMPTASAAPCNINRFRIALWNGAVRQRCGHPQDTKDTRNYAFHSSEMFDMNFSIFSYYMILSLCVGK